MIFYVILIISLAYACILLRRNRHKSLRALPTPPGSRFFFGHYGNLGPKPHETFTRWKEELGSDIYSIKMGQTNWVILNSDKAIGELIQKRGAIYSSRQDSELIFRILSRGKSFGSSPYNDHYRKLRAIVARLLSVHKIASFFPIIDTCTRDLLRDLLYIPNKEQGELSKGLAIFPRSYIRRTTMNIIMNILFGRKTKGINDPMFKRIDKLVMRVSELASISGRSMDFFPILRYVPNYSQKKEAYALRDETESAYDGLFQEIKNDKNKNPCFIRDLWERREKEGLDELDVIHLSSNLIFAGTDTVSGSITWLLAVLANNPQIQAEAHQELDKIVGRTRLPNYSDTLALPYTRSIIREGQRYCPPTFAAVPHYIEQDDEYMGYHIPKDSFVIINNHATSFDPTRHPNPYVFDPKRWLNVNLTSAALANGPQEKRDHFSFGGGRRTCVGINLAECELFVILSRLLWAFNIENASPLGKDNQPMPIDLGKAIVGLTLWPMEYHVRFLPRGDWVKSLLIDEIVRNP
ncbi:1406_t:CDS:2 [Acaulospora morrowiae]|uniref:1406_t:CDS:1 n=1 Tax=Acaulospora morrowiae TaxID=94023 RepID=A0A9N8W6Q4_9GLOM|nr:1406_t:CDS:2 [Acaulospora morrowiae]